MLKGPRADLAGEAGRTPMLAGTRETEVLVAPTEAEHGAGLAPRCHGGPSRNQALRPEPESHRALRLCVPQWEAMGARVESTGAAWDGSTPPVVGRPRLPV